METKAGRFPVGLGGQRAQRGELCRPRPGGEEGEGSRQSSSTCRGPAGRHVVVVVGVTIEPVSRDSTVLHEKYTWAVGWRGTPVSAVHAGRVRLLASQKCDV